MAKCGLLLVFLAFFLPAARATSCHPDDLRALRGFAGNLSGGAVLLRAAWSGASCCGWEGVSCDGTSGRVTMLRLPGHGLVGPIPGASLAGLARLEELNLANNKLVGTIPSWIGELDYLCYMDLSDNSLVGEVPKSFIRLKGLVIAGHSLGTVIQKETRRGPFRLSPTCGAKLLGWTGLGWPVAMDMHHLLFDCCTQLKHLSLHYCDAGRRSLWKIDAPNSKLSVLEIDTCCFERIELICLPELEKLHWDTWVSEYIPLTFGDVPSLGELKLSSALTFYHTLFKLSELLHGTTSIHTLTLDFQGENLWIQPQMKQLCTAFNKLRKLTLRGIFVEFDIIWTTAFLEASPSMEILLIEVWDHVCSAFVNDEEKRLVFAERKNPQWEMDFHCSKNLLLKELQFVGFRSLEQQFAFIRALLDRAPNLQTMPSRVVRQSLPFQRVRMSKNWW